MSGKRVLSILDAACRLSHQEHPFNHLGTLGGRNSVTATTTGGYDIGVPCMALMCGDLFIDLQFGSHAPVTGAPEGFKHKAWGWRRGAQRPGASPRSAVPNIRRPEGEYPVAAGGSLHAAGLIPATIEPMAARPSFMAHSGYLNPRPEASSSLAAGPQPNPRTAWMLPAGTGSSVAAPARLWIFRFDMKD